MRKQEDAGRRRLEAALAEIGIGPDSVVSQAGGTLPDRGFIFRHPELDDQGQPNF